MALITCPYCGKQISSLAEVCPHCKAALTQRQQPAPAVQPTLGVPYQKSSSGKGGLTAFFVILGILLAAGAVLFFLKPWENSGDDFSANSRMSDVFYDDTTGGAGGTAVQPKVYNVTLNVSCKKNDHINIYDADILVDGKKLATLAHGTKDSYNIKLAEGSHKIEFRINGKHHFGGKNIYDPNVSGSFCEKTLVVASDKSVSYDILMDYFDTIVVK